MQFPNSVVLLVVLGCLTFAQGVQLNKELAEKVSEECRQKAGATEMDVMELFAHKPAASQQAKCLRACCLEKLEVMHKNGKFNQNGAFETLSFFARGDEAIMYKLRVLTENCGKLQASDEHCQAGEDNLGCVFMWAKKLNVSLDF